MKLSINIEFTDGTKETFIAQPPEFVKWEAKSGFTVQQAGEKMGITDFLFLAYNSMKRNAETIADVVVGEELPKVISEEA